MAGQVTSGKEYAAVDNRVLAALVAAALLLSAAVCALHFVNAVGLRGTARMSDYAQTDAAAEGLIPLVEAVYEQDGILYVSGALMRPGQYVREVRVRVALLPMEGDAVTMTLLNTQMVRRYELARDYGCDDHCGFHASALSKRLDEGSYAVALADESDGTKRLIDTGARMTLGEGGALLSWSDGGGR